MFVLRFGDKGLSFWSRGRTLISSRLHMEGMKLNGIDALKSWPECAWHPESRPLLYRWLSKETSKENQERLHCVGNIVMPDMAYLAANLLGHGAVP